MTIDQLHELFEAAALTRGCGNPREFAVGKRVILEHAAVGALDYETAVAALAEWVGV